MCAGFCISIRFQRQKAACKGGMKNWAPLFQVNEISVCTRQLNLARQTGNSHQIGKGPYHHRLHLRKYTKQSQGTEHFIRCYGCSHRDCMWYPDCVITLLWCTLTVAGGDGDIWGLKSSPKDRQTHLGTDASLSHGKHLLCPRSSLGCHQLLVQVMPPRPSTVLSQLDLFSKVYVEMKQMPHMKEEQ